MKRFRSFTVFVAAMAFLLTGATAVAADSVPATDAAPVDRRTDEPPAGVECDRDRPRDRPGDCRAHDRARDFNCVRDGDLVDRPIDCRNHDRVFDRPFWRRCYNWVVEHTDIRPVDELRFWWRLCHRWWWNQHHAV